MHHNEHQSNKKIPTSGPDLTLDLRQKSLGFQAPMVESKTVKMFSVKWHTIQMTFLFEAKHQGGLF